MLGLKLNHVSKSGHWWFGMWIIQLFNSKLKMMIKILLHTCSMIYDIHTCMLICIPIATSLHAYAFISIMSRQKLLASLKFFLVQSRSDINFSHTEIQNTKGYLILVRSYRHINIATVQTLPYHAFRNVIQLFTQLDTFGIRTRFIYTSICFIVRK